MEFASIVENRIEIEDNPKKVFNALVCFKKEVTGKALSEITSLMSCGKQKKSSITLLNLISEEQANSIEDENIYKSKLLSYIINENISDKTTVRTFVKESNNIVDDIIKTAEEQNCDIIMTGIDEFNPLQWNKYLQLKENSFASEEDYIRELGKEQASKLRVLITILNKTEKALGILVGASYNKLDNIFAPILKEEDVLTFSYLHQIAKGENVTITVWDAIGILESNNKIQKIFSTMTKKAEGEIKLWDNNKKISIDFMKDQDLMIIGRSGWEKLVCTPLCWIQNDMPSTLIIKDKKT